MCSKRILNLSGGFNFRDLGGYPAANARQVKWCKLVRSGYLSDLTDQDLQKLVDYGINLVIDLRSKSEVQSFPDRLNSHIKYINLPIFQDDQTESGASLKRIYQLYARSDQGGFQKMMRSYRKLITDPHAQQAYHHFFELLEKYGRDGGILFHCSAGKDRTGMCTMLLLAALGVDDKVIREDYLLTNPASKARIEWRRNEAKKMHLGRNFVQSVEDLASVRDEYYDQLVGMFNYQYGGIPQYLKNEIQLTKAQRQNLRKIYLD